MIFLLIMIILLIEFDKKLGDRDVTGGVVGGSCNRLGATRLVNERDRDVRYSKVGYVMHVRA